MKKEITKLNRRLIMGLLVGIAIISVSTSLNAQVAPTAQTLPYSQDFSGLAASSTTFPAGWNVWKISNAPTTSYPTIAPSSTARALTASATNATNSSAAYNYGGSLGWFSYNGSADLALVLAINTTGITGVSVSYEISTVRIPGTIQEKCQLQYGTSVTGTFTGVNNTEYTTVTTPTQTTGGPTKQGSITITVTLPSACDNQSVIYLRWADAYIGSTAPIQTTAPSFTLDNVSVSQACPTPYSFTLTSLAGTNAQTPCINSPITNITYSLTNATGANVTGLPTGVTGSYSGGTVTISGTPSVSGNFTYTITPSGGCGSATTTGTINVSANTANPVITSTLLYNGDTSVSGTSSEANGTVVTVYKNGSTSIGTSTVSSGAWSATVSALTTGDLITATATATGKCVSSSSSSVTVASNSTPTLGWTSGSTTQAVTVGSAIGSILYTWGGSATTSNVVWTGSSSSIPSGINETKSSPTLTIAGTPTLPGTYNYSVTSTDGTNTSTPALTGTLTVKLATPDVTSGAITPSNQGFTAQWAAVNNITNYTLKVYLGATVVSTISSISSSATSQAVTGLSANTSYTYTVTAIGDGSLIPNSNESAGSASVKTLNTAKAITVFSITGQAGSTINGTNISVVMPYGTIGTSYAPSITQTGVNISPTGAQDFSSPVQYTVTAEDGSTQIYTATVSLGSTATDYFRTKATGNWNDNTKWQSSPNSGTDWYDATLYPDANATSVSISHNVTYAGTPSSVGNVTVNSGVTLTNTTTSIAVASGQTLTIASGGTLDNQASTGATITAGSGSIQVNGTYKMTAVNASGSVISLTNINFNAPTAGVSGSGGTLYIGGAANFRIPSTNNYNIEWASSASNTLVNVTGSNTISGNLTISNAVVLNMGTGGTGRSLTINGDLILSGGGSLNPLGSPGGSATQSATINGNVYLSGASKLYAAALTASAGVGTLNIKGNVYIQNPSTTVAIGNGNSSYGTLSFTGGSQQHTITVNSSVTSSQYTVGDFTLNDANGLALGSDLTIGGTATLTNGTLTVGAHTLALNGPAIAGTASNLSAGGTSSISIGGSSIGVNIPSNITTLNNLTLNNSNGTTLQAGLTVGGTLTLTSGALATGSNTMTLNGAISGSGTINTATTGTLAFGGTSEQTLAAANLTSGAVNVLTVKANAKLTTTGSITATTLNILNDGTSAGTGTLKDVAGTLAASQTNVSQFISGGRNWYLSSPVTGATGSGVLGTSTASTKPICFDWYDESKGSASGWTTQASTLTPALGYVAINSTITPSTDGTLTFSGALNTGSIPLNLTTSSTTNYVGYNLVGNPFPAYLDISNLAGNSNLVASYWYRTYKSGGYVFDSENLPSGLGTSLSGLQMTGKIPPLQAFWLLANNAYSFSFSSANCVHQDNTNNKFRAPSTVNATQQVLRIQVSNGINSDEAIIYSNAAASNTYDAYDTPKMSNNNAVIPEIATIVDGHTLVINGFNTIPVNTELPLLFTTAQQNSFSIKASQFNNFDAGTQLILKDYADPLNPILTDISNGNSYSFSSGITTNNSSRFALIFKAPSIATAINQGNNDKVWISTNVNNQIMINGNTGTASVTVYNALGQKIYSNTLTSNLSVLNTSLCSGLYVVSVTTEGKSISKKVIID